MSSITRSNVAVIGIGLPGSGKTHMLRPLAAGIGALYLCPDDIRQEINGDAGNQGSMALVWDMIFRETAKALGCGQRVVVDSTCARRRDRLRLVRHCRAHANGVVGMWFTASFEVCQQRNLSRERIVPLHAMERMQWHLTHQPPTQAEGFGELLQIDTGR